MTSKEAFVWLSLPDATEPVVCGRVWRNASAAVDTYQFVYGKSYRNRADAIQLLPHALPVREGGQSSRRGLHGVLRDAAPDAWGRRVLLHRLRLTVEKAETELDDLDYLLAGAAAPGALHFQSRPNVYESRPLHPASLEQLLRAAEAVEQNAPLPAELEAALFHGTSIGGARPKALLETEGRRAAIAKFSSTTDVHPMVRLEALGLELARAAGIDVVESDLHSVMNRDVLVVPRFDIKSSAAGESRRHFFSALTALDLDEMEARYASYPGLADYLRKYADEPAMQCAELFRRMALNIMIGNTDDHARNHALFWDGRFVRLTPAYDLCIIPRVGQESSQAMDVGEYGKSATIANALSRAGRFGLSAADARAIVERLEDAVRGHWQSACERAGISSLLAGRLLNHTVLSPAIYR